MSISDLFDTHFSTVNNSNSTSLCLFRAILLAEEMKKKFYTSINSINRNLGTIFLPLAPEICSKVDKNKILMIKLEL